MHDVSLIVGSIGAASLFVVIPLTLHYLSVKANHE